MDVPEAAAHDGGEERQQRTDPDSPTSGGTQLPAESRWCVDLKAPADPQPPFWPAPDVEWDGFGYVVGAKVGVARYTIPSVGEVCLKETAVGRLLFALCPCSAARMRFPGQGAVKVLLRVCCYDPIMEGPGETLPRLFWCRSFTPMEELPLDVPVSVHAPLSLRHRDYTYAKHMLEGMSPSPHEQRPRVATLGDWGAVGFKLVAKVGGRYFSIGAGTQVEYALGRAVDREAVAAAGPAELSFAVWPCTAARQVVPGATPGGLYSAPRALLRCLCEGPITQGRAGGLVCTRLTPVEQEPLPACCAALRTGAARLGGEASPGQRLARSASEGRPRSAGGLDLGTHLGLLRPSLLSQWQPPQQPGRVRAWQPPAKCGGDAGPKCGGGSRARLRPATPARPLWPREY